MKRLFAVLLLFFLWSGFMNAQKRADRLRLYDENSFSMILMGDPQGYVKYDFNQPILELCTAWIADNIENLNIKTVLCTGDLVECNEYFTQEIHIVNQTSKEMWEASSKAFARLDNKVPYIVSCGNHDYGYRAAENSKTHFPEYFPFERNSMWRNCCVKTFPNRNGVQSLENAAFEFKDKNWGDILIITSEFGPRDEVLEWAKNLSASEKYQNHKVVFMTHSYLEGRKDTRIGTERYKIEPKNSGVQIWEKLVYPSSNIVMVICGHDAFIGSFDDNVGYRVDKNVAGREVHQMMFNVQTLGGGWEGNGGDGWLRILEFMPDGQTIKVRTYSPLFGISPSTKHLANRTESCDQFDIVLK